MKRLLSLGLAMLLIFGMTQIRTLAVQTDNGTYTSVVEDCMLQWGYSRMKESDKKMCRGLLYDFNGDGQDELVLQYKKDYTMHYEIWTIKDGTPRCVVDDPYVDPDSMEIAHVNLDGSSYVVLHGKAAGSGSSFGELLFFRISDDAYENTFKVYWFDVWDEDSGTKYRVNGETVSKSEYDRFHKAVQTGITISVNEEGLQMEDLLEKLKSGQPEPETHGYLPVLKQLLEFKGFMGGRCFLYDVDGNGVEELILFYSTRIPYNRPDPVDVAAYSVYTMEGNTAVPLVEQQVMFLQAGGAVGSVSVVETGGKIYIATQKKSSEYPGWGYIDRGEWHLLSVDGLDIEDTLTITYEENWRHQGDNLFLDSGSAFFNGVSKDYREYEKWLNDLNLLVTMDSYNRNPQGTKTAEEMYNYIRTLPPVAGNVEPEAELEASGSVIEAGQQIEAGQKAEFVITKRVDGEAEPVGDYTLTVSDPTILEVAATTAADGSVTVQCVALRTGTVDVTLQERNTGAVITVSVTATAPVEAPEETTAVNTPEESTPERSFFEKVWENELFDPAGEPGGDPSAPNYTSAIVGSAVLLVGLAALLFLTKRKNTKQ